MKELPPSRVLFTHDEILAVSARLASDVNRHCAGSEWLAVCVMQGGLMFTGELLKHVNVPIKQDFVRVTRYHESVRGGELRWLVRPESNLRGRRVLLIDDIFDEGETLRAIAEDCLALGADEVFCVVLVEKEHDRKPTAFRPDLVGFTCHDEYVFGFGMDIEGYWRNLPDIRELLR